MLLNYKIIKSTSLRIYDKNEDLSLKKDFTHLTLTLSLSLASKYQYYI